MLRANKLLQVSERHMHVVRWVLTTGWLVMIFSLFWDPFSSLLTTSRNPASFFYFDSTQCIQVQGNCLPQQPLSLAIFLFWALVVPSSILILLVFGHDTWRRICPLSFLSQIPRSLGLQRKRKSTKSNSGAVRYELVKIRKDSWLGQNHLYVQFGLLALGLTIRLLFVNADRLALGLFLVATILAAITVGYLYEGKSWCQYFCPMAPVQMVFTGPRGLLGSEAHQGQRQTITQSMCRTIDKDGNEKSACVGCQSPCLDIDAERTYWETSTKSGRRFIQYGYVGLLLGFFLYYFLYAGNFDYLFSGAWMREANLIDTLFNSGFYIAGQAIVIPKLVAVPLTLTLSVFLSYWSLTKLEKFYRGSSSRTQTPITQQQAAHFLFSLCTFFCFNLFFFFSSHSLLANFPFPVHLLFNGLIVLVSTLWLSRTFARSSELYTRESLAGSLRRQLSKLTIDFSRFLEGRSMEDLKAEEVYVLAKVLPGVNQEQGLQVYKGVLREALEQGTTDSASSLETLRQLRQELNIKDEDHFRVLTELGSAEPDLLNPQKRRTREGQLRIESYWQALASILLDLVESGMSLQEAMQRQKKQIQFLKLEYGMTSEEEDDVLNQLLSGEKTTILRKADALIAQMEQLVIRHQALSNDVLDTQTTIFKFLRFTAVQHKQHIITKQMLGLLEVLGDSSDAIDLATKTRDLAANVLPEIFQTPEGSLTWESRLKPAVLAILEGEDWQIDLASELRQLTTANVLPEMVQSPGKMVLWDHALQPEVTLPNRSETSPQPIEKRLLVQEATSKARSPKPRPTEIRPLKDVLYELLNELDPLNQTLALYGLNLLIPQKAAEQATQFLNSNSGHWLLKETARIVLERDGSHIAQEVQTLILRFVKEGVGERRVFQQPVVRIGSHSSNDVVVAHGEVVPHHVIFYQDGEGFSVLDLGGGVWLGNQLLKNDCSFLSQGQVICLGDQEPALTVNWEKQPFRSKLPTEIMGTLDKVLLLFESRFFQSLKPDALVELGRDAIVKVYVRGEYMCLAGDPSDSILLLIDGAADVVISQGDSEQVVGMVNVGETIGEMGVLTRQKRSASVVSASDYCRALVIQADKFDAVLRQDPEVARNLLVVLSTRLQSMINKIKTVAKV